MQVTRKFGKNQYLFNCFLTIPEPRVRGRCPYSLLTILVIVLCGLICVVIVGRRWIDLNAGVPSHQTIARVFSLIELSEFERCLRERVEGICTLFSEDVIAIDGKTMRGSGHKQSNKKATHLVNAFHCRLSTVLGSTVTPSKSNEIKGIPILIKDLEYQGQNNNN